MRRAVVLAGGLGTRLRPYTTVLPKPLMPVGDRPVLDIVVRQLERAGFDRITMATGYLAELIEAFFGDGSRYGIPIDYFREGEPLGTVGALGYMDELTEDFLVMNGDVLTDLDLAGLMEEHRTGGQAATIAARRRDTQISLGVLLCEDAEQPHAVTGYLEKPVQSYEVSMGVYCFHPRVRDHIEAGERLDFPDLVLRLIAAGERVVSAPHSDDRWLDIGRPDDYELAQTEFADSLDTFLEG